MKYGLWLAGLMLVVISALVACSAGEPLETPVDPAGPALIMFYTDN